MELDARQRAMLKEMGVPVWLPKARAPAAVADVAPRKAVPPDAPVRVPAAVAPAPSAAPAPAIAFSDAEPDWPALVQASNSCDACGLCAGRRSSTLLPPSAPQACDWLVVGDPPDEDEDRAAQPFAGADGVLLDNMLGALALQRVNRHADAGAPAEAPAQRAYVTNVVKCRPPHGQLPHATDLAQCARFLQQEIRLARPRVILAMGRFAVQLLLSETPALSEQPLGRLRGTVYRYQGIPVVLTYHPRALLRHGADKAKAWQDLCLAADTLEATDAAGAHTAAPASR